VPANTANFGGNFVSPLFDGRCQATAALVEARHGLGMAA
jgi:hypothetical protein